ncbi:trypsin-like serine protease [Nonomuraea sp. NPDC002799]
MIAVAWIASLASPAAAITNGSADGNAHPEVGALIADEAYSDGTWSYCTGTLISPTVFLTAAHCGEPKQKTAHVSFADKYEAGAKLYTGRYLADPRYRDKADLHDMAVVVFDTPVTDIKPAQLPTPGLLDDLKADGKLRTTQFTPVGFGMMRATPGSTEKARGEQLRNADIRNQASISFKGLTSKWLDLSPKAADDGSTCSGDSGGPNFLGGPTSHLLVATSISGADDACRKTNYDYRLDTATARSFLDGYVTLPA